MNPYQNNPNNYNYNYNNNYGYYSNEAYQQELQRQMHENSLRRKERNSLVLAGVAIGGALILQLIIELILVTMLKPLNLMDTYNSSSTFQSCYNVIVADLLGLGIPFTVVSLILRKNYKQASVTVVPAKKLGLSKIAAWTAFGMGVCVIGNLITNLIIKIVDLLGYKLTQPEIAKPDGIIALIAGLVATAIAPAIFEEYAMRCVTLGALRKYGKGFAVFAVSVVFGLIHGNVIQFVFAFIVGLGLGYVTAVTDNIVPAMLIHGFNNGISVVGDFFSYYGNDKLAESVQNYIIVAWAILAVAALVYLAVNRMLLPKKDENAKTPKSRLSFGVKLVCLLPGFAIPFLMLLAITSQYIQKK